MTTKISTDNIQSSTLTSLSSMRISNVSISNSTYTVLDDTAVNVGGGYIVVTGSGFQDGATVLINETQATAVSFVDSTELHVQVPAKSAATYNLYVVNPDGATAIRVNGLTYSGVPTWVTTSPLTGQDVDVAFSIVFDATGATSYSNTTALPAGTTLLSNGYFYGTVTGIETETTYSFTVQATDAENQESNKTFEVTVSVITPDTYFNSTVLLLQGDGTNNAENETFVDSGNNTYSITRGGSVTQGSFSPFSPTGWSAYFDGNGDYLSIPYNSNLNLVSGDFTVEFWIYKTETKQSEILDMRDSNLASGGWIIRSYSTEKVGFGMIGGSSHNSTGSVPQNTWTHVAICRSGNTSYIFINGVLDSTGTLTNGTSITSQPLVIGEGSTTYFAGYLSNIRIIKNTALYTSNFTPSTTPLTAVSGTSLLTLQSNRFVDNSTNGFTITRAGDTKITAFSPFAPTEAYSPTTHGGSAYFDGTDDYLEWTGAAVGTNSFTFETWFYPTVDLSGLKALVGWGAADSGYPRILVSNTLVRIDRAYQTNEDFTVTVNPYQWNHLVMVRDSSIGLTVFVNGVRSSTGVNSGAASLNYQTFNRIGWSNWDPDWLGYLAGTKFVVGTATYSPNASTITVPTAPPSITTNTNLLLKYANAGIYDSTAKHLVETIADSKITTSVKKYGTGSIALDGTGDYLSVPNSPVFSFQKDFTVECWCYYSTHGAYAGLISMGQASTWTGWQILFNNTNNSLLVELNSGSQISFTSSSDLPANQWNHVALVRNGSSIVLYINGTSVGSTTSTAAFNNTDNPLKVGVEREGTISWNGYIDDLRITKGIARYTTNFTPPAKAFTPQ